MNLNKTNTDKFKTNTDKHRKQTQTNTESRGIKAGVTATGIVLPGCRHASQRMAGQGKQWCFTINNYSEDEYERLRERAVLETTYCIVGKETGEQGTAHLQGYCILRDRKRLAGVKAVVGERAHCEQAKGSPAQNREYCSKEGDYWEHGRCPASNQKKRTRDEVAAEFVAAVEGEGIEAFIESNPGSWLHDGGKLCRNYVLGKRPIERPNVSVVWLWGEPGCGKSRAAHERLPRAYLKEPRTKWWNGYMLQRECIMDDVGPGGVDLNHLLRWFDRYKLLVEVKGDMCPLYVDTWIVTSNYHPRDVFKDKDGNDHAQIGALMRRMKVMLVHDYESAVGALGSL